MSSFDSSSGYPTRPRDYSLDMWLFGAYFFGIISIPFAGPGFTSHQELLIALVLGAFLVVISFAYRLHMHWHWPGIQRSQVSRRLFPVFWLALLMVALLPGAPPDDPRFLPIYLCLAAGLVFNVLFFLGISPASKTQFLQKCTTVTAAETASSTEHTQSIPSRQPSGLRATASRRRSVARMLYRTVYLIICVIWIARFDLLAIARRHGSPQPTADQPAPIRLDGHLVYLAHYQQILLNHLPRIGTDSLMLLLFVGILLNYLAGLNLYPNLRSREQRWRDDHDDAPPLDLSSAPSSK